MRLQGAGLLQDPHVTPVVREESRRRNHGDVQAHRRCLARSAALTSRPACPLPDRVRRAGRYAGRGRIAIGRCGAAGRPRRAPGRSGRGQDRGRPGRRARAWGCRRRDVADLRTRRRSMRQAGCGCNMLISTAWRERSTWIRSIGRTCSTSRRSRSVEWPERAGGRMPDDRLAPIDRGGVDQPGVR